MSKHLATDDHLPICWNPPTVDDPPLVIFIEDAEPEGE